jgi:hypothetical protein
VAITCFPLLPQQLSTATMTQIQTGNSSTIGKIPLSINMQLSKGYVDGKMQYFLATDALDAKIAVCGKTTLIRCLKSKFKKLIYLIID